MSITLKASGLATQLRACLAVDDDNTVKDFVSGNTGVYGGGAVGTKSWKGSARRYFTTTLNGFDPSGWVWNGTIPDVDMFTSGFTVFIALASFDGESNGNQLLSIADNSFYLRSAAAAVVQWETNFGVRRAIATARPAANTSYSIAGRGKYQDATSNVAWGLESAADLTFGTAGDLGDWIEDNEQLDTYGGAPGQNSVATKTHIVAIFNGMLSDADLQALHDDWFGTLFDASTPNPTITDVDGDESVVEGQAGVVLTGTDFNASQDSGKLELWSNLSGTVKVVQTISAWSNGSITFTVNRGAIPLGTCYAVVTTSDGRVSTPFAITVTAAPNPTITNVSDEVFFNGETGVVIEGSAFGASQGAGKVYLSPTNNVNDVGRVEQTVTAWGANSITITVVKGALNFDTTLYLFVVDNGGLANAQGYSVQIQARPFIREQLVDLSENPVANESGLTAVVYHSVPTPAAPNPAQVLQNLTTDGSGHTNWQINRGALALGAPVWLAVLKDGTPARGTLRKVTPVYE